MAEYWEMVQRLAKPGENILQSMTPGQAHLLHMAIGICGEAGELIDAIKKNVIYGKPLDFANVIEELGDIEFYLEGFRQGLGLSREVTILTNMDKLSVRYPDYKYTDTSAITRADKEES